ncbi:ABC transporter permease, partial [bacterium]|nr:ABC transporter permease [bacterium]
MSYEFFIANRYLKSKRKTGFISLINYISIAGVMIGVAALIIVLSIMNGFESEVRSRIIGFRAHLELRKFHRVGLEDYQTVINRIKDVDHIIGISPYIDEKGLIIAGQKKSGVGVKGIDPGTIELVSDIKNDVGYGDFQVGKVETNREKPLPGIVLGRYLADKLGVGLGDKIQILSPSGISPILTRVPHFFSFQVTGLFETGIFEIDDNIAYISISEAQRLFEMKAEVTGLEIKLDDLNRADAVAAE